MDRPKLLICKDGFCRKKLQKKCNSQQYSFVIYEVSRKHSWVHLLFHNESMASDILPALRKLSPQKVSGNAYHDFIFDYVYLVEAGLPAVIQELKNNQHIFSNLKKSNSYRQAL